MPIEETPIKETRIAIVHDWLTTSGGAERVLEQLLRLYPKADLFTLIDFLPEDERSFLGGRVPVTSFLQTMPLARRFYRFYLPLMPFAVEQWDFSGYDLVISSSYAVVKGLITGADQLHVGYVHSPMRYAWDLQESYLRQTRLRGVRGLAARLLLHRLRLWDQVASQRVDVFIANSAFVARRIEKLYRRKAIVVPPPVALPPAGPPAPKESFFLTVSRLVPYKRIDLIAEAFAGMPEHRLVIIGEGPERARVTAHLAPNITYLGRQPDSVVADHLARCRAFVFAAVEDFGIAPLEAQAHGKPVIALAQGGVLETLRGLEHEAPTALFYDSQDVASLRLAVRRFDAVEDRFSPENCRMNAARFGAERFAREFSLNVEAALAAHRRQDQ